MNIEPSNVAANRIHTTGDGELSFVSERASDHRAALPQLDPSVRPAARGKFLFVGDEKFHVRGVTYGTFRPQADGAEFPVPEVVERDFALMAARGVNSARTYTVPPTWMLDAAARHGLRLLVGIPVERHIGFLTDRKGAPDATRVVRDGVAACAGHPAVLAYAIGNEIPAASARWHGRREVEQFLERLYRAVRTEDHEALVTYVNYPSTEYLDLPFLDFVSFNVFLEARAPLAAYLARLQHIAGERPLVLTEVGLDSLRNGDAAQARTLDWQIRTSFAEGCAGLYVYSWTDEWYRAGEDVYDWKFGLTDRERRPKPALAAVQAAFGDTPFSADVRWPRISVVVCTYNGQRTIRDCMEGLRRLRYPDFEVIVVNDGSTDQAPAIASEYDVRLISTENRGLSSARNIGWQAATGEIVAYLDDDAYPDPDWLTHLAATFLCSTHVGVGGPNIAPPGDGKIAKCVALAPGNPTHVMLTDREAEHIPGCNMAFRRAALEAIGGFDPRFRVAGDDVDVCWALRERGGTLGFSPAAVVWHHRRNSLRAYWKQQVGYGRAEGLLERKWPEKYTATGQIAWAGRLYGMASLPAAPWRVARIYHGIWGFAPFQRLYAPAPTWLGAMALAPEWYLPILALMIVAGLGLTWTPLRLAIPLLALATLPLLLRASVAARIAFPRSLARRRIRQRALTALLHMLHPLARLHGRLSRPAVSRPAPWGRWGAVALWCEQWRDPAERLSRIERALRDAGAATRKGGEFERFDLEVRGGLLGGARLLMAVEEHGRGMQLVRVRWWLKPSTAGVALTVGLAAIAVAALATAAWIPAVAFGAAALWSAWHETADCARAAGDIRRAVPQAGDDAAR